MLIRVLNRSHLPLFNGGGTGPQFFVATNGSVGNDGSIGSPWDFGSVMSGQHGALNGPALGATVFMRGGAYPGSWTCGANIRGTNPNGPFDPAGKVHIKSFPGEVAVLTDTLTIPETAGPDIWWWDLDIKNTNVNSADTQGIDAHSPRHGFIRVRCIDHSGDGFGNWVEAPDNFILQCASINNGFTGSTPGESFGHGYYIENQTGFKRLWGNIAYNNFGYNYHHYGSGNSFLNGGDFRSCGACAAARGQPGNSGYNFLLGGGPPLIGLFADSLMSMSPVAGPDSTCASIGYFSEETINHDAIVQNCFFDGKVLLEWWDSPAVLQFLSNFIGEQMVMDLLGAAGVLDAATVMNNNAYNYNGNFNAFALGKNQNYSNADTIAQWRTLLGGGREANSTQSSNVTSGQKVVVWANPLDPGQGTILIKNSAGSATVNADLSSILQIGQSYSVYHHHSLRSSPVVTATYDGNPVAIPMNPAIAVPAMLGGPLRGSTPVDTRPFSGQFWVRS